MADIKIAVLDDYMKIADSLADWTSLPDNVHTDFFTEKLPDGTAARATARATCATNYTTAAWARA